MKKQPKLSWIIYTIVTIGLLFVFYFCFSHESTTGGLPPPCKDSIRKDSSFRDSLLKVEAAAAAAEYAKRQADSLKKPKFDLTDTTKNKR